MSSQTPNLNLVLPVGTEHVSRQIINDNNTKIDTAVGSNTSAIAQLDTNVKSKQPVFDAGLLSTTDVSTAIASAINSAYSAGVLSGNRNTAIIAFSLSNTVIYSVNAISYNAGTFYFTAYTHNTAYNGYVGLNATSCSLLQELATKSDVQFSTINVSTYSAFVSIYNALDSNPSLIAVGSIGNQESTSLKSILPNPTGFANYTSVSIKKIGTNTMIATARQLYGQKIAVCYIAFGDTGNWYRTDWEIKTTAS